MRNTKKARNVITKNKHGREHHYRCDERREFAYQVKTKRFPSYYWNQPWIYFDREHQKYMLF